MFKGFDEVKRLGLCGETEKEVRLSPAVSHGVAPPGAKVLRGLIVLTLAYQMMPLLTDKNMCPSDNVTIGMLVVEKVIPESPASAHIEAGDVLVRVNGRIVTHFLLLEEILDDCVGGKVQLEMQRGGKQVRTHKRLT